MAINILFEGCKINLFNLNKLYVEIECALKKVDEKINILFATNGGAIFDALEFYEKIKKLSNVDRQRINIINIGEVNSSGIVVFLAFTNRFYIPKAKFMIHAVRKGKEKTQNETTKEFDEKMLHILNATLVLSDSQKKILETSTDDINIHSDNDIKNSGVANILASKFSPPFVRIPCYDFFTISPNKTVETKLIDTFLELVRSGGKVATNGLRERIEKCELLAFFTVDRKVVAISAIKKPLGGYIKDVLAKAKINRPIEELKYELGYSFTKQEHRKKGYSSFLKSLLLEKIKNQDGVIFCTTAISSSQNFLVKNGFNNIGESFEGENDKNIRYFEKILN